MQKVKAEPIWFTVLPVQVFKYLIDDRWNLLWLDINFNFSSFEGSLCTLWMRTHEACLRVCCFGRFTSADSISKPLVSSDAHFCSGRKAEERPWRTQEWEWHFFVPNLTWNLYNDIRALSQLPWMSAHTHKPLHISYTTHTHTHN